MALGSRHQPQIRTSHDTQGALGADEKVFEVVAGVVLQHPVHGGQHGAIGEHGFQSQHQAAHHSVAHHSHAARVGGDVAADGRGRPATQVQGKHQAGAFRFLLRSLQRDARLDAHRAAGHVNVLNPSQRLHRQNDVGLGSSRPVNQPRQSAVRHHYLAPRMTQPHHSGNLRGVLGAHQDLSADHAGKRIVRALAELLSGHDTVIAYDGAQIAQQLRVRHERILRHDWPGTHAPVR